MRLTTKTILVLSLFISFISHSQTEVNTVNGEIVEFDKCGFPMDDSDLGQFISPEYMGYSYDSLLIDLELWRTSKYVKIDSIGLSVQGRPLWQLTVSSDPDNVAGKRTVHIHARTHPQETEGFYVTEEILNILLSESELAQTARANCVFYIIPMYNPDGVELGLPRRNANNVDLEANWNTFPHQPEVAALKARFIQLMASPNPIEVMLNMHSSSLCTRYFVYHHENGTSPTYAVLQQNFINGVRSYYPNAIEPYSYFVSWASGTALQYPESWCWLNHGENILAITYEDKYKPSCPTSGNYDSTANAILRGVLDYMNITTDVEQIGNLAPAEFRLEQNYPNPFNPCTSIQYAISKRQFVNLKVYNLLGNEIATLVDEYKPAGIHNVQFTMYNLASGIYFYQLKTENLVQTKKMILLK
ncbi:MAG TPA: M14 family zinc carboxypeptidase [Ignavibacteriaceae bacterium]